MIVNESQQSTETISKPLGRTVSSAQVAEKFITPVIQEEVFQAQKETPKRVICVAVDDSPQSQHALTWTLDHLASANDQVCILNVRPYAIPGYILGGSFTGTAPGEFYPTASYDYNEDYVESLERYNRDTSHDLLRKYGEQVLERGVQCRAIALRGDPREEILAKVNVLKPDMLVTGCRGLGFLQKAFKGSLSDYLVQHAECVVVVPKMNA
ncbi:adenine nucleotide alpha hydrolases-like protein [Rhizoclosmatium globosum]|uniref:Adenine nucleotide alpha hydrolases-like protein n=1 Tax=Rhizoclosmatium globosum TaxID=329046 RepID=A0A1Y2CY53_9FUNG|nr:adenine nucleotide alpha hydrolases-like protein [Rhizoclosmatium globosum]|eukprot:ORY51953.1 adenine nucleotide alpha hydrolases-like protein [Rhizoclosmatium globosum]